MKRLLLIIAVIVGIGMVKVNAESFLYSAVRSTFPATDIVQGTPQIAHASCKVQSIGIWHVYATTATYKVYTSALATGASRTLRATIYLPATAGYYSIFGSNSLNSAALTGSDLISMPYLYIRQDNAAATWCANDTIQIIYKK